MKKKGQNQFVSQNYIIYKKYDNFKAKLSAKKCLVLDLLLLKYCKQWYTFNRLVGWGAFGRESRTIGKLNASYDRLSTGNNSAFRILL